MHLPAQSSQFCCALAWSSKYLRKESTSYAAKEAQIMQPAARM